MLRSRIHKTYPEGTEEKRKFRSSTNNPCMHQTARVLQKALMADLIADNIILERSVRGEPEALRKARTLSIKCSKAHDERASTQQEQVSCGNSVIAIHSGHP